MYINCHTYYSLNYGTFSETQLLELAKQNNVDVLALTDINNTSACLNFIRLAQKEGIKPIVGIDFRNGSDQQFVGLANNNLGFQELNSFLSVHLHNDTEIGPIAPEFQNAYIIYPFEKVLQLERTNFRENEFIGLTIRELNKLPFSKYKNCDNLVLKQPVTFRNKKDFNVHRLIRAIGLNTILSKLEESEEGSPLDKMLPLTEVLEILENHPGIVSNTQRILDICSIGFGFDDNRISQNQQSFLGDKKRDFERLKELCNKGLYKRYPNPSQTVERRLERELATIKDMGFVPYFLINHDIVEYARNKDYPFVGRGSGANSIVAYVIGITEVDPIELDLYFERFINPYRTSPPDFDIDFSWREREDVTAYIFKRFKNVALLATYNTFKYKAAVREVGKVFGLPKEEIDKLSVGNYHLPNLDSMQKLVLKYSTWVQGMPNYISVHSAGILILDKSVHYYSATSLPPKGFPTVQFDMIIAEDVGIFKYDILGQRGLAKIKDTIELVRENQPDAELIDIDRTDVFKKDEKINALLSKGGAIGAYYVESPAMRGLMKKLRTHDYLGLVAASSVIRPGVSSSGMKDEYIKRERDPMRRKQANPHLWKIMPETHGIMVYQEDVLKVAHLFAGLDLGEADVLRRGMSGKFRSREEFKAVEEKYFLNCRKRGYGEQLINEVWEQIKSFAGYAFAKGHSASYAVESYQSLYLKCYFPIEFMTAVLNNGGGFYDTELYIHEARKWGAVIHPPCINTSDHPNVVIGNAIYLGFGYLRSLEKLVIQRILTERQLNGKFRSFDNFIDRIAISMEQLTILIRIDGFRFTGIPKKELLWQGMFKTKANSLKTTQRFLFRPKHRNFKIPILYHNNIEDHYDQLELLGFPLCSYFDLMADSPKSRLLAKDMPKYKGKMILIYGSMVHYRLNTTSKGDRMAFTTMLDMEGEFFDCVHFPQTMLKTPIRGKGVYACYGKPTEEFGHYSFEVVWTKKMSLRPDPRHSDVLPKSFSG
ncbi:DNA polymerase III subunit alpha [Flagellimonas hymeniacidonis]|uniref:DNA polymerase III subunit alpha n=1 Tax=Flagellimonas hymeniacidonis TaxID=2603628 RepID=A0A5C8V8Q3_9FLAO|nr:DNA polymerase III subunit alpha [Flagellimonas hymeniacidonis]TXN37723.1 DNA polymerase III subunit alpha [Flagellimonas hymeniacidonis]